MKIFVIFLLTAFIYLPIILNPHLLLDRNNDLQEQFWPIFYYIKQQFLTNHELPFWNNMWFSGTPLLPDPQFSLFYPPNLLFLILPTDLAFLIILFLHIFLGGLGIYLISKKILKFSELISFFTSAFYIFNPKLAGFLEAGHPGLVESYGLLPINLFFVWMLSKSPNIRWLIFLSIGLASLFFAHTIIFLLSIIFLSIFYVCLIFLRKVNILTNFFRLILAILFGLGLSSVTLLPQLDWSKYTTRFLLLANRDVYPKWDSHYEIFKNIFFPWMNGIQDLWKIDSEKWLSLGIFISILAVFGFLRLQKKIKILISFFSLLILIMLLNNASPFYRTLLSWDWYVLMRVTTRAWPIIVITITLLAGFGLQNILKRNSILTYLFASAALVELLFLSWVYFLKPIPAPKFVPDQVYKFLKEDKTYFRVFCTTRCLSQKEAAKANLEILDSYNTLQQINFYKQSWQLMGGYWNYYSLSIPPIGFYQFTKLTPDPNSLGNFNVKYIISPYPLTNKDLSLQKQFGDYLIYKNNLDLSRSYFWSDQQTPDGEAKIIKYSPNYIRIDTSSHSSNRLVLSQVYSNGWRAFLDGKTEVQTREKPDTLTLVNINSNTKFVDFKYQPKSFEVGATVTLITSSVIFLLASFKRQAK